MSKYKIKILPIDGKFIGYALLNDEIIKQTGPCKDTISASRELSKLLNEEANLFDKKTLTPTPVMFAANQTTSSSTVVPSGPLPSSSPRPISRKCCGRG
jgi:hypothetical protein